MADKSNTVDLGGLTLIVNEIKTGATKPNQAGSDDVTVAGDLSIGDLTIPNVSAVTVAGGDAATAGASHVIPITIDGTDYFILLTDANA